MLQNSYDSLAMTSLSLFGCRKSKSVAKGWCPHDAAEQAGTGKQCDQGLLCLIFFWARMNQTCLFVNSRRARMPFSLFPWMPQCKRPSSVPTSPVFASASSAFIQLCQSHWKLPTPSNHTCKWIHCVASWDAVFQVGHSKYCTIIL